MLGQSVRGSTSTDLIGLGGLQQDLFDPCSCYWRCSLNCSDRSRSSYDDVGYKKGDKYGSHWAKLGIYLVHGIGRVTTT